MRGATCCVLARLVCCWELFVGVSDDVVLRAVGLEQWLRAQLPGAQSGQTSLKAGRIRGWVPEVGGGYIWSPCSALQLRPASQLRGIVPHPAGQQWGRLRAGDAYRHFYGPPCDQMQFIRSQSGSFTRR